MKKTASLMYLASCVAVFAACDNEDRVKEVSKEGAVETFIQIDHLNDSLDIIKPPAKCGFTEDLLKQSKDSTLYHRWATRWRKPKTKTVKYEM